MTFGGYLSRQHEVTLLGRKSHMDAIRREGIRVSGIWGRHTFRPARAVTDLRSLGSRRCDFNLILVTVKSYDTSKAAAKLRSVLGPGALVLSLQNGLGNIDALHRAVPRSGVLAGRVITGVEIKGPGSIRITVTANPTAVGETTCKRITPRVRSIARMISRAGIPCIAHRDVVSLLWGKVVYNCALNPLASLLGCHYGALTRHELTRAIMEEVIKEVYKVARRARVDLKPSSADRYMKLFYDKLVPRTYHHHPSMLHDLKMRRKTEISAMNGKIADLGRGWGIETPVNRGLCRWIREKERL